MITITALSFHMLYTSGRYKLYDDINKTRKRKTFVLELYNQGKTYREISKVARISPRDIGVILNKAVEEKDKERIKQQDNDDDEKHEEHEHQHLSLAAKAYKLFSDRKTPLEVAIALNLKESEATKFYREYWKLKQLHNLNMVYEELRGDIEPLLRLYRLSKSKGMGVKQVVNLLEIADNDLPALERRFKRLGNDMSMMQFQKRIDERKLYQLNNQIATATNILNSIRISCIRERREIENLCNEKARLKLLVTGFKSNNEEYLKIKQAAEEEVQEVLTNSKLILKFATLSVIESLKRNPELCNFVLNDISNKYTEATSYGSNYLSLTLPGKQQQQSFSCLNDDIYSDVILDEAEKLYNKVNPNRV
jgi:hypothetical protein